MEPDAPTLSVMSVAARARAKGWRLVRDVVAMDDPSFVERLRDGRVIEELREIAGWLGEDDPFAADALTLRAFVSRSKRFTLDDDVTSLRSEWARLFGDTSEDTAWCAEAAQECDAEADAWEAADHERAKELRLAQFQSLRDRLQPLADWCAKLDAETEVLVARALARIVAVHLGVEAGRDLRGELFG